MRFCPHLSSLITVTAILLTMAATGCKSSKTTTSSSESTILDSQQSLKQNLEKALASYGDWNTLKASGKITIGGQKSFTSSMQMTMVRNQEISISLRPMLGIEMGKIYITNDSIFIINKIDNYYIAENLKLITGGVPLTVSDMQSIFLSRIFELGSDTITADASTLKSLSPLSDNTMSVEFNPLIGLAYAFKLDTRLRLLQLDVAFAGVDAGLNVAYSGHNDIAPYGQTANDLILTTHIGDDDLWLELHYNSIEWEREVKSGIKIGSKLKRIPGTDFLKITVTD